MEAWNTERELAFLDGLGSWAYLPPHNIIARLEKLKRYLKAINNRYYWGDIEKHKVERYCLSLIERIEATQ